MPRPPDISTAHGGDVHLLSRRLGRPVEEILDFSASINPLGPPPTVLEALGRNLLALIRHYPEPGAGTFTQALAGRLDISPGQVLAGNGSTELILLLPRLKNSGRALIVAPAFGEYEKALSSAGWRIDFFLGRPEDGFSLDKPALLRAAETGFDLVFLGHPANPDGRLMDLGLIEELAGLQASNSGLLVVDEAFIDFAPEASCLPRLGLHPSLVVLRSLTKFFALPGLRLGYAVAAEGIIAALGRFRPPWSINALAQAAGLICLDQEEYAEETRNLVAAERPRLASALGDLGMVVFPSAANYLLFRLPAGSRPARQVVELLAREGILLRDCANYRGLGEGYLRAGVRLPQENARLAAALGKAL